MPYSSLPAGGSNNNSNTPEYPGPGRTQNGNYQKALNMTINIWSVDGQLTVDGQ